MKQFKVTLFLCSTMVLSTVFATNNQNNLKINFPTGMNWHVANHKVVPGGEATLYTPGNTNANYPQNVTKSFQPKSNLTFKKVIQNHINLIKSSCTKNKLHILSSKKDSIVFTLAAWQCPNMPAVIEVVHGFQKPEGNYFVNYTVDPTVIPKETIDKMKAVILSATF